MIRACTACASGGAKAAGTAVETFTPVPVVNKVAGWATEESIKWLVARATEIKDHPKECQKLLELLDDDRLHKAAGALDQLTDLPAFEQYRRDYEALCEALAEAEVLLLQHVPQKRPTNANMEARLRSLLHRVLKSGKPKDVRTELEQICNFEKYKQMISTLQQFVPQHVDHRISRNERAPSLQRYHGPADGRPGYKEPDPPPPHIFKHSDDLIPRIDEQLKHTRHIGIVGMGGIGKTTIARAVFQRAKPRFDEAVWLTVGNDAKDMLPLLKSACAKLFPDHASPFKDATRGREALAQLLHEQKRTVLLVLDDVWPSIECRVLAALNFATDPDLRVNGSRLIVTTRFHHSLSYSPRSCREDTNLLEELEVFKPSLLDDAAARQLFRHHAYGGQGAPNVSAGDLTETKLIKSCGGNPLALTVLGSELRQCTTAEQWEQRLAAQEARAATSVDPASATCARSVDALPPSLKECFVDFAMFPEDARIREAALLHLFATHAPLHTPDSLRAAEIKLNQLISRSLVSKGSSFWGNPEYYMHDILRDIALQRSLKPESRHWHSGHQDSGWQVPPNLQYLSAYEPADVQAKVHKLKASTVERVRACMLVDTPAERKQWQRMSLPRLQWLWMQGPADEAKTEAGSDMYMRQAAVQCIWPTLKFLKLKYNDFECLPEAQLCAVQLAQLIHLDLSGCRSLTQLPEGISGCSQLQHLDLSDCGSLTQLPEGISGCSQLQHLDLSYCGSLTQLPEGISGCSQLQHLDLSDCERLTQLPEGISGCSQLQHLNLRGCRCLTQLPEGISGCSQLQHLNLRGCRCLTQLPEEISACSQLQHLDLRNCGSLTQLPEEISACSQLQHLDLSFCRSLTQLPEGISACSHLQHLDLSFCRSLTQLPEGISGCTQCLRPSSPPWVGTPIRGELFMTGETSRTPNFDVL